MSITRKPDFSNLTSMGVGGRPRELYEPESFGELCELLTVLDELNRLNIRLVQNFYRYIEKLKKPVNIGPNKFYF